MADLMEQRAVSLGVTAPAGSRAGLAWTGPCASAAASPSSPGTAAAGCQRAHHLLRRRRLPRHAPAPASLLHRCSGLFPSMTRAHSSATSPSSFLIPPCRAPATGLPGINDSPPAGAPPPAMATSPSPARLGLTSLEISSKVEPPYPRDAHARANSARSPPPCRKRDCAAVGRPAAAAHSLRIARTGA